MFALKVISNCLAAEENKLKRHMKVTGRCRVFDQEREDVGHGTFESHGQGVADP
jgi:hypothetical protein